MQYTLYQYLNTTGTGTSKQCRHWCKNTDWRVMCDAGSACPVPAGCVSGVCGVHSMCKRGTRCELDRPGAQRVCNTAHVQCNKCQGILSVDVHTGAESAGVQFKPAEPLGYGIRCCAESAWARSAPLAAVYTDVCNKPQPTMGTNVRWWNSVCDVRQRDKPHGAVFVPGVYAQCAPMGTVGTSPIGPAAC